MTAARRAVGCEAGLSMTYTPLRLVAVAVIGIVDNDSMWKILSISNLFFGIRVACQILHITLSSVRQKTIDQTPAMSGGNGGSIILLLLVLLVQRLHFPHKSFALRIQTLNQRGGGTHKARSVPLFGIVRRSLSCCDKCFFLAPCPHNDACVWSSRLTPPIFPPYLIDEGCGDILRAWFVAAVSFTVHALEGSPMLRQDLPQTSSVSGFFGQPRVVGTS